MSVALRLRRRIDCSLNPDEAWNRIASISQKPSRFAPFIATGLKPGKRFFLFRQAAHSIIHGAGFEWKSWVILNLTEQTFGSRIDLRLAVSGWVVPLIVFLMWSSFLLFVIWVHRDEGALLVLLTLLLVLCVGIFLVFEAAVLLFGKRFLDHAKKNIREQLSGE
jgi:hypothetical protein